MTEFRTTCERFAARAALYCTRAAYHQMNLYLQPAMGRLRPVVTGSNPTHNGRSRRVTTGQKRSIAKGRDAPELMLGSSNIVVCP